MELTGVFAPLPTPFDVDDRVDTVRLRAALSRWLATPLTGFVVLGSTGEAALMDDAECDRVIDVARSCVPASRPLLAGTGRESTRAAVAAARRAAELGADAVLVRTPSFFKSQMTSDVFVRHYETVAEASPVPVLLYNFPAVTGVNLLPSAVIRLSEHPNIVGLKESGRDIGQIADLVAGTPASFRVLSGSGSTFYAALCAGVAGGILAVAGLLPEACVRIFTFVRHGRFDEARALQQRLVPVAKLVGPVYGVAGLKVALELAGWDVGSPRPPLLPASADAVAALRAGLAKFEEVAV
jgi:4-hydroxy-2-oxoglutarate aldolase